MESDRERNRVVLVLAGSNARAEHGAGGPLLAQAIPQAGRWSVTVVELAAPHDAVHPTATPPGKGLPEPTRVGPWELLPVLDHADVVHIFGPCTVSGERALVAAKALGRPVVVSGVEDKTSEVGLSFGMLDLCDAVIYESARQADLYPTSAPVHVLSSALYLLPAEVCRVYDQVADTPAVLP